MAGILDSLRQLGTDTWNVLSMDGGSIPSLLGGLQQMGAQQEAAHRAAWDAAYAAPTYSAKLHALAGDPWMQAFGVGSIENAGPALDMSLAARMGRAADQGYTIDAYKGAHPYTGGDVTDWKGRVIESRPEFPLASFESPGKPFAGFFSSDPEVANRFARALSVDGGAVYPTKLKMENPLVIDAQGKPAAAFQFEAIAREHGTGDAYKAFSTAFDKTSPHDGVILSNTGDEGTVYVPRASNQVRSRFAAFDPAKIGSSDILAGLGGAGLLGALYSGSDQ
jgi:hypothetical protein